MRFGMVGLGRMGAGLSRRAAQGGHEVVAFDQNEAARTAIANEPNVQTVTSLAALIEALPAPRSVWLMLPAGEITETVLQQIARLLERGDLVIEGGNSHYPDSQRRGQELAERGIAFMDAGVSGGVWGLTEGFGLMVGGSAASVAQVEPLLRTLAPTPDTGWVHAGDVGAGHFTKMVHNGIEYGLMQAYAEGFAVLQAKPEFDIDLAAVAEAWRYGTVIRSWLLDLMAQALTADGLAEIAPVVADSGEGRWTVQESVDLGVPAPVISAALTARFTSQGDADLANRLLAATRRGFGGHAVTPEQPN
jgi:6-phosphogluconate dehydrogenase